ncbi:hypothetical protein EMCG_07360 [[Emmonsia] crescens]|uniref:Uncharacterized protein n=1 Tax=[Emmonsia] crescens TaxID=73230 RepID=A0A0G2J5Q9_9EURO|nr:hypothetical protein EMCG_07360 [Emmonsia crescens UAMH 3008]
MSTYFILFPILWNPKSTSTDMKGTFTGAIGKDCSIKGPFVCIRISGEFEISSLKRSFDIDGFSIYIIPAIVRLPQGQWDLPVHEGHLHRFRQIYGRYEIEPFSEKDLLTCTRGKIGAARAAISALEAKLQNEVWDGLEGWFNDQISKYKGIEEKGNANCACK